MRVDAYTHFIPETFFNKLVDSGYPDIGKRMRGVPCIYDREIRKKIVDQFKDYAQNSFLSDAAAGNAGQRRRRAGRGIRQGHQ